jgi:hypothetical protein
MWTATQGVKYFIFVHSEGEGTGDFSFSIVPGGLLIPNMEETNNRCGLSLRLETPVTGYPVNINGTTVNGLIADDDIGCGSLVDSSSAPSMWYSVIGSGSGIRASTCNTESGFVARLAVYIGDCENLICIDGGDENCGDQSSVAWFGEDGTEYFILVEGLESRVGEFNLTLQEVLTASSSDCNSPFLVPLDGVSIIGSTENAQIEDVGFCQNTDLAAPSAWYSVQGTGATMVASTCNSQSDNFSKLEIYSGSCSSLSCPNVTKYSCGNQMQLTWVSSPDEVYLLQVYGSGNPGEDIFALEVEEVPVNYECVGAADLIVASTVRGTTKAPAVDGATGCSDSNEHGAWYKIDPRADLNLTLSACSDITNFLPQLSLYQGSTCGQLSCVAVNNGIPCGDGSFITWNASSSEVYYLLVQGAGSTEFGNFELTLGIENDICDSSIGPVAIGIPVSGSTRLANIDKGDLSCFESGVSVQGPGVWYSVSGTNSLLKATTCSSETNYDSKISVFEGAECSSLRCIAGNDNDEECGSESSVTWFASQEEIYHILVHGYEPGDFVLQLSEAESDSCATAFPIPLIEESNQVVGGTSLSQGYVERCTGEVSTNQPGTWFTFRGTGGLVQLDGCASGSYFSQVSSLSVYGDSCSSLSCEKNAADGCSAVVDTTYGEDYSIYVRTDISNVDSLAGFNVFASNNRCDSAFGPISRGDVVLGSTIGATGDDYEICGEILSRGSGVWYSFVGTGEEITFFTCSKFTDFDTQLTLYRGDDCGNLECLSSRDDNCGTATWMTHPSSKGNRYYLLVSGKPGRTGKFVLQVL